MSQIRILIVEDEPIIAADLKMQLEQLGYSSMGPIESGEETIKEVAKDPPDLIVMDIQLDGNIDGIDTAHHLNQLYDIPIIFLTSNTDLGTFERAKLTKPHAFLSKPFRTTDIVHSIDLAILGKGSVAPSLDDETVEVIMNDRLFIRDRRYMYKVLFSDIIYIEADNTYSIVKTAGKTYVVSQTMKRLYEKVGNKTLLRVHRSYIVNPRMIDRLSDGYAHIGDKAIPIGRAFKAEVNKWILTM